MIRIANKSDKEGVNSIRRQVQNLHAKKRPDMFRSDFSDLLQNRFDYYIETDGYSVIAAELAGIIVGYAVIKRVCLPKSEFCEERRFVLIEEFGVDEASRRMCIGTNLINFVKLLAKD